MSLHLLISSTCLFFTIIFGLFVLLNGYKTRVNRIFCFLCFLLALWILTNIIVDIVHDYSIALFVTRLATVIGASLPLVFYGLVSNLYFSKNNRNEKASRNFLKILYILFGVIVIFSGTKFNIESITVHNWGIEYSPGILYYFLLFYLMVAFGFSFVYLFNIYKKSANPQRSQAKLLLIGTSLTLTLTVLLGIILPLFGSSYLAEFAPASVIIYIGFITLAVLEHHLFNIRIISIEIVTFCLWVTLLIRIFLAPTRQDMLIGIGILLVTVVFGILLIRGTLNEIRQREQIEKLTEELRRAYARTDANGSPTPTIPPLAS